MVFPQNQLHCISFSTVSHCGSLAATTITTTITSHNCITILIFVTLQGSVCAHTRWSG